MTETLYGCSGCSTPKMIEDYYICGGKRQSKCKSCVAVRSKLYRQSKKSSISEYNRKYYEENKDYVNTRNKEYRNSNMELVCKINREYRQNNKKRLADRDNKKYAEDPEYCMLVRLRKRLYAIVKNKGSRTLELTGCSGKELCSYLERLFKPGMTWENRSEWHVDHILPLKSFDLKDPEQLKIACHYTNLQPMWAADNIRKSDKMPWELNL